MRLETVRKGREKENVDRRGKHLQPKPLVVWQGGVKLRCSGATFLRTLDSLSLSPFPPFLRDIYSKNPLSLKGFLELFSDVLYLAHDRETAYYWTKKGEGGHVLETFPQSLRNSPFHNGKRIFSPAPAPM